MRLLHPHPPPPLPTRGLSLFPNPKPPDTPDIPSPPIDRPKKSKVYSYTESAPTHRFTQIIHYTVSVQHAAQNLDATTRPEIEFQLNSMRGHPPRRPMTTVAWDLIDASKKVQGLSRKKAETSFQKFSSENRQVLSELFPKNLAGESSGTTSKVA